MKTLLKILGAVFIGIFVLPIALIILVCGGGFLVVWTTIIIGGILEVLGDVFGMIVLTVIGIIFLKVVLIISKKRADKKNSQKNRRHRAVPLDEELVKQDKQLSQKFNCTVDEMMALKKYIIEAQAVGYSEKVIMEKLTEAGWSEQIVKKMLKIM